MPSIFDDATTMMLDAFAPEYRLFGQKCSSGSAWASAVFPDSATIITTPCDPSTRRGIYLFAPCANPFNVLTFFLDKNSGSLPVTDTFYYYNSAGEEVSSSDPYVFYIAMTIYGGKAYFSMEITSTDYNTVNGNIRIAQTGAGYTGCSLDVTHITQDDYKYAEFHIFAIMTAFRPDLTNLDPGSGGGQQYNLDNSIMGFMNGTLQARYRSNDRVSFQDAIYSAAFPATTSYDSGVQFFSPDFSFTQPDVEGYHYLNYTNLFGLSYWQPDSVFQYNLEQIDNFTDDTEQDGEGGTSGNYNPYSDAIGFSGLPNLGFTDTGFARLYTGTSAQIKAVASYMWNDSGFDAAFRKWLYGDNGGGMNAIINFGILPIDLSSYAGSAENITIGNVPTTIPLYPLTQEYVSVDMGYIDLRERWGTCVDYEPTTVIELFLPFVGFVQVQTSDVMRPGSANLSWTMRLRYNVNLFTGDFMAELVGFTREAPHANILIAQHAGNMMIKCPTSAGDYSAFFKNIFGAAAQVVQNAAGGLAGVAGAATGAVTGAIQSMSAIQPVQRSGTVSGGASVLGALTPYIVVHQPEQWLSGQYGQLEGFPSMMSATLGNLSGYTEVDSVELDTVVATQEELTEIENLLKGGVYL